MTFGETCGVLSLVLIVFFALTATALYWAKRV
jgi:hypothetical protein